MHQRFDACPYGLIQWPHLLNHQGLCQGHIARTQCRHRGQQALLDKARAVGEEILGQARFVFGVGARFIGLPYRGDGGDVCLDHGRIGANGRLVRRDQRDRQQQTLLDEQGLYLADFGRGGHALGMQRLQRLVGLGDAPQPQTADKNRQQGQQQGQNADPGGDFEAAHGWSLVAREMLAWSQLSNSARGRGRENR